MGYLLKKGFLFAEKMNPFFLKQKEERNTEDATNEFFFTRTAN